MVKSKVQPLIHLRPTLFRETETGFACMQRPLVQFVVGCVAELPQRFLEPGKTTFSPKRMVRHAPITAT